MKKILGVVFSVLIILSGCATGDAIDKKVYSILESAEENEASLAQVFNKMEGQEEVEKKLYTELLESKEDSIDSSLSKFEASIDQRQTYLAEEAELMTEIHRELIKLEDLTGEEDLIHELKAEIKQRNQCFEAYETAYTEQLTFLKELITLLNEPESNANEEIKTSLNKLDILNKTIQKQIELFNQATDELNVLKKEYYKKIDVQL